MRQDDRDQARDHAGAGSVFTGREGRAARLGPQQRERE